MNRSESNGTRMMKLSKYLMWIGIGASVVIGILVVIVTLCLYAYFWDYSTPMFN